MNEHVAKRMRGRWGGNPGVMSTWGGKRVNLINFKPHMVDIGDIAHALSKQCRFNGHINRIFTVAEHSLIGAMMADTPELRMEALLHDAGEAYTGDIILPFKEVFPEICEIEDTIAGTIFETLWPDSGLVVNGKYQKSDDMAILDKYMGMCESMQFRPHLPLLVDQHHVKQEGWQGTWFRMMQKFHDHKLEDVFVEQYTLLREELVDE